MFWKSPLVIKYGQGLLKDTPRDMTTTPTASIATYRWRGHTSRFLVSGYRICQSDQSLKVYGASGALVWEVPGAKLVAVEPSFIIDGF